MNHADPDNIPGNRIGLRRPSMNSLVAASIVLVFLGGLGLARSLGWWKTTGGGGAPAVIRQGNFAGVYDPADIRGSTSFGTLETYFNVPASLIAKAFGIQSSDPAVLTAKFVDSVYGVVPGLNGDLVDVGTDAVRLFVATMAGLPYTPEEATGLPQSAIDLILASGIELGDQQRRELLARVASSRTLAVDSSQTAGAAVSGYVNEALSPANGTAPGTGGIAVGGTGFVFQGKTSFADLLNAGLTQEQIESVLGQPMGPRQQSVKDFCLNKGLQFSAVRTGLSQLMGR